MRLRIEKAVTDAIGLSHDENGKVVLVSGALPGELAECSVVDNSKGVVKAEAIEASDEEVEAEYKKLSENYGMDIDRIKQMISVDNIKYDLAQQKAIELLKNSVK